MDPHAATIEQIAMAIAALQGIVHGLSQRIDRQQTPQILAQEDTQFDTGAPLPPPLMAQMEPPPIPHGTSFVVQRPTEVILPHAIVLVQTTGFSDDRIQRVKKMLRQLRVAEGMDVWDGFYSALVTPLPPKF